MDLNRLNYFICLSQSDSLQEASDILGISPPALSKAMKVLEDEMGVELWMREGRRMALTEEGQLLAKEAPKLVDNLKNLKEQILSHKIKIAPLKIGTFEVFSTYFLSFIKTLKWDDQQIELHELLPGEIEKFLVAGDIDMGISYMPIPNPKLDFLKVSTIEMGVFVKKGSFKGVDQPNIPFVVPVMPLQGVPTKIRGLDGWPTHAYQRDIQYRVTLMESALELCRQGRVAGYFPCFIVEEHNRRMKPEYQLIRKKFPGAKSSCFSDVFIIKRKSSKEDQRIKQMAKVLRKI